MGAKHLDPRRWLSFSGLILGLLTGFLGLLFIPFNTAGHRDARQSEGEQMLGSLKGQARVAYAKTNGQVPRTLTGEVGKGGSGVLVAEMDGKYYQVLDIVGRHGRERAMLFALPRQRGNFDPMITMRFSCAGGEGEFTQYGDDR
jgi:hypothetical protein